MSAAGGRPAKSIGPRGAGGNGRLRRQRLKSQKQVAEDRLRIGFRQCFCFGSARSAVFTAHVSLYQ
jgi:hypothetical protein